MGPPAVSCAMNEPLFPTIVGFAAEKISSAPKPVPDAGNCCRIEAGTVKLFCPAVVIQRNDVVPAAVDGAEDPKISTRSVEFPPVQLRVSPWLRFTTVGTPPVTASGVPMVTDALNLPTSLPPAPFNM